MVYRKYLLFNSHVTSLYQDYIKNNESRSCIKILSILPRPPLSFEFFLSSNAPRGADLPHGRINLAFTSIVIEPPWPHWRAAWGRHIRTHLSSTRASMTSSSRGGVARSRSHVGPLPRCDLDSVEVCAYDANIHNTNTRLLIYQHLKRICTKPTLNFYYYTNTKAFCICVEIDSWNFSVKVLTYRVLIEHSAAILFCLFCVVRVYIHHFQILK